MNLFDTIMTIYSARYQKALKQKLIDLLRTYDSFKNIQSDDFKIPNNFPKCFQNKSLLEAVKSIKFSLDNDRHVFISGNEGTGKTQLVLWFGKWCGKEKKLKNQIYFIVCT